MPTKKYESFVVDLKGLDDLVNERAESGWRLVSVCPDAYSTDNKVLKYLVVLEQDRS